MTSACTAVFPCPALAGPRPWLPPAHTLHPPSPPTPPSTLHPLASHLLRGVLPLLEALAAAPDVRPPLAARFAMASWLAGRGGYALYEAPCGNLAVAAGRSEAVAA